MKKDKILAYQFHPESIMTLQGRALLEQSVGFLRRVIMKEILNALYHQKDLNDEEVKSYSPLLSTKK